MVVAIVLLVAGCGAQVDTAKVTYPRTTVPAGQAPDDDPTSTPNTAPRANDPAFTPEKLRAIDPCPLLDDDVLDELGTPANTLRNEFGECANYMEDVDGKELNITLTLGDKISNAVDANDNIGGLPGLEDPLDEQACFVSVVTSTSPNIGITIQANGASENLCEAARTVMIAAVDRIRTDAPLYDTAKGSLAELDPCTFFEGDALNDELGGQVESDPYNLHWCTWSGPGASLGIWFRLGYDPATSSGDGNSVDLGGGVTAYQEKTEGATSSCRLDWKHRPFAGDDVEIVGLTYDVREPKAGEDPCVVPQAIAKTLVPALPKA